MMTTDMSLWEQFLQAPMYYIYWGIAILASLVFTIQTIMLFVGFDTDADFGGGDVAFDVDGLALVSVKTVSCFLLGFGWSGVILAPFFENGWIVALISLGVGALFMLGAWFLLKQVLTLSQDNTFHADKIVGYTCANASNFLISTTSHKFFCHILFSYIFTNLSSNPGC